MEDNFNNMNGNFEQNKYNNPYPVYQPYMQVPTGDMMSGLEEPVSVGEWILTMILCMIPCVNIIMLFVWAISKNEKKSKSNYCKAQLIVLGIVLGLYLLILFVIAVVAFILA